MSKLYGKGPSGENKEGIMDSSGNLYVNVAAGGAGGGAATVADGADVTQGALADAVVAAGATGSISAKLRRVTQGLEDLKTLIVLAAGTAIIGKVGIDQTTDGTTNKVKAGIADGGDVTFGAQADSTAAADNSTASYISLFKRLVAKFPQLDSAGTAIKVKGGLVTLTGTFTRPANTTAYAVNQVVSNSVSSTTPVTISSAATLNAGSGYITGIRVTTNLKSIVPIFRIHFFNATSVTLSVDGANFQEKYADVSKRIGYYDMPAMITGADTTNSDMSRSIDLSPRIPFNCAAADTAVYVVLETLTAFTPANAQQFSIVLNVDQN